MKRSKAPPTFELALAEHRQGRRDRARALCDELLARDPNHAGALYLLGSIELEEGRPALAVARLERSVALAPRSAVYLSNLGLAYARTGALDAALRALVQAIRLDPQLNEAVFNLGLVLVERGELEKALVCLSQAALALPKAFRVHSALAKALVRAGRASEGLERFRAALELEPKSTAACIEMISLLEQQGQLNASEELARHALAQNEDRASLWAALSRTQAKQGKDGAAVESLRRASELEPASAAYQRKLGFAYFGLGNLEDGLAALERALELDPTLADAESGVVFYSMFSPRYDSAQLLERARHWDRQHVEPLVAQQTPPQHPHDRSPERRLRVGYVSPDFRDHTLRLFLPPVLREHDRSEFELVCYSSVKHADAWTERFQGLCDAWHDVRTLGHGELAERIRVDQIDVLVDLSMHMAGHRLKTFAERPAPVQLTWFAYPGTTGVTGIDYRITDPYLDPHGPPLPYSEQSLWVPHSFWCYEPSSDEPPSELPAASAGYVTFGCLNNFLKVNSAVLALWARVLVALPSSRLLLLAPSEWAEGFARAVLETHGVARERVEFVGLNWRDEYLKLYRRIDIGLDCFPYNGHTTSFDAFWMGVPVVTLLGATVGGRAGYCQARNLGLDELVARSPAQFVESALHLARDLPRLLTLRAGLRARLEASPLMDAKAFTRGLEAAYRKAWRHFCATTRAEE